MSDDVLADPPFDPEVAPYSGDEVSVVNWLLDYQRRVFFHKIEGITEGQARVRIGLSELSLLGLTRHLAYVEQYWFGDVFLGASELGHWEDPDDRDRDFHPFEHDTLAEAVAVLGTELARSRRIAGSNAFDTLAKNQRDGQPVTLRWILVHLLEEWARHCGHADLLREAIDGVTGD